MEQIEIWKDIPNFNGLYQASPDGRIRGTGKSFNGRMSKTKILQPFVNKGNGYLYVHIMGKVYSVHRLIAETFIPNPENKPCVGHRDTNRQNASVDNLEWVTYTENNHNPITLSKNIQSAKRRMLVQSNRNKISESVKAKYAEDLGYRNRVSLSTKEAMRRPEVLAKISKSVERIVDGVVVAVYASMTEAVRNSPHCIATIKRRCEEYDICPTKNGWRWKR